MKILDRYILWLFLKVLLICFVSLTGLFFVIDAFGNLDEFLEYSKQGKGLAMVLAAYYGPRVLSSFDLVSPLLSLVAAMFALTWLQRTHELTAIVAAGVPPRRVIVPLIVAAMGVSVLAAVNRECMIPRYRNELSHNAQDLKGNKSHPVQPKHDHQTNILINGRSLTRSEQKIEKPTFVLHTPIGPFRKKITAAAAFYQPASHQHPAGYRFVDVVFPEATSELESGDIKKLGRVIFSPSDTPWLESNELFVASGIQFNKLSNSSSWIEYSSVPELIAGLHNLSLDYGADVSLAVHSRFVRPFLDMTLLFLGLPFVFSRGNRNIFVAAGMCLLVVAIFYVTMIGCKVMGSGGMLSPSLAAWAPLLIFAPIAFVLTARLRE
ncbi:MAG: LptF/LptG family permease [bacterium]|nr:LptF/LptG family permease [bacterium]